MTRTLKDEWLDTDRLRRLAVILRDEHRNGVPRLITQRAADVLDALLADATPATGTDGDAVNSPLDEVRASAESAKAK